MGVKRTTEPFKRAFLMQKSNAHTRGIGFLLTFDQWKEIWIASGHWDQRGRGAEKYCMCRIGDAGAYEVGNVFIDKNSKNVSDGNIGKPVSAATRKRISDSNTGKAHPWSLGINNPMHRPEVKEKMRERVSGSKHYKARKVVTPDGVFGSGTEAAKALGIPKPTIYWRCKYEKSGFAFA